MSNISKVWKICLLNFKKWAVSPRLYVVAALILVFTNMITSPIVDLARSVNESVNPWLMPFIMSDDYMILILFICAVILFCDAPFIDEQQPYIIIRSNKSCWAVGQILYIILACLVFSLFVFVSICVNLIGRFGFSTEWGKIIGTLAQTDAGIQFESYILFDYQIMVNFSAVQATLLTILLVWAVSAFLGLLIFLINTHLNSIIGPVIAFAFVLAEYLLPIIRVDILYYFSPVSWVNLKYIDIKGISFYPNLAYIFTALCLCCAALIVLIIFSYKKGEIKTQVQI